MCVCIYIWVCAHDWHLWKAKEGIKSPDTGVTGDCKPPGVGAKTQTQVLPKSAMLCS